VVLGILVLTGERPWTHGADLLLGGLITPPYDFGTLKLTICINSLRELPYMKAWAARYRDAGLAVIGVHAPEFGFERDRSTEREGYCI
jgi:hypothetical protein